MGNYLQSQPTQAIDYSLIYFLKTKTIQQIQEVQSTISSQYPGHNLVNYGEFEDIYGSILGDRTKQVFLLLQNDKDIKGDVDIYESITVLTLFGFDDYSEKISQVFTTFDFNANVTLEMKEIVLTFQTVVRALCKIVNIVPPSIVELESAAQTLFKMVDTDRSGLVSVAEFETWVLGDWALQDFLLKYAFVQTLPNAERRYEERVQFYNNLWDNLSRKSYKLDPSKLKAELEKINPDATGLVMAVLTETSEKFAVTVKQDPKLIYKKPYQEVMAAVAAFDTSDANRDNKLSVAEIRYLICLFEQRGLSSNQELQDLIKGMGKTEVDTISLKEWLDYLNLTTSQTIYLGNLRRLFLSVSRRTQEKLSIDEVKQFLKVHFAAYVTNEAELDQAIQELFTKFDGDNDKQLQWEEFRDFTNQLVESHHELSKFQ